MTDINGWPVMASKCKSCPFGPKGDQAVRATVEARLLDSSQICHHPRLHGKEETHLCRGARDHQLMILHRLGWLDKPTDECFAQKSAEAKSHGVIV